MNLSPSRRFLTLVLVALLGATPAAAQTPEPADLLPFSTLVSLEVRHPSRMAREVLATVKGTALEDYYHRIVKMRSETPSNRFFFGSGEYMGMLGLVFSPEVVAEFGRGQGAAVALTGFDKDGFPEVVGLIHPGESNFPAFFLRGTLSFNPSIKLIDEVEKVGIYRQAWERRFPPPPGGNEGKSEVVETGPFMVSLPGVIALTSSRESARDVILRYKGKASQPALSSVRAFRDARELRERPGLFLAVDVTGLTAQIDEAAKRLGPQFKTPWDQLKLILEPRAVRRIDASLTLHEGDLELLGVARLDPAFKSPIVELFPTKPLKLGSLAAVSPRSWGTLTLGVEDAEARVKTILAVADAIGLAQGVLEENLPSKTLPALEKLLGFAIAQDVVGRIEEVTLFADQWRATPLVAVQARDEAAAKFLQDDALPRLLALATRGQVQPRQEEVGGHKVQVYTPSLASTRIGSLILLGPSAEAVGAQVGSLDKKELWTAVEKNSKALKAIGNAEALLTLAPRSLPLVAHVLNPGMGPFYLEAFADEPMSEGGKFARLMGTTMDEMGPLVFRITREPDTMKMQARLDGVRTATPKLIDAAVKQAIELERQQRLKNP